MKNIKYFIILFLLLFSCIEHDSLPGFHSKKEKDGNDSSKFYRLELLSENLEVVSPSAIDLSSIAAKTEIVLRVNIPQGKVIRSFNVNGNIEILDVNNRYTFIIYENTTINVIFKDTYVLNLGDNLKLKSPLGLNLDKIPEDTEITVKIELEDNKAFKDLTNLGAFMGIENPQYKFEIGEVFIEHTITMNKSYYLEVEYLYEWKIPSVDKYGIVLNKMGLKKGNYVGKILVPNFIETLAFQCFKDNTELEEVKLSNSIGTISGGAFWGCSDLVSVEIPNVIEVLSGYCFYGCEKLNSIEIPDSVNLIGNRSFQNCIVLTEIFIPNNVNKVGEIVFDGCVNLNRINCEAYSKPNNWKSNWLGNCSAAVNWGQTRP